MFIDIEKTYDKVSRDVLKWVSKKNGTHIKYINAITDMYEFFL